MADKYKKNENLIWKKWHRKGFISVEYWGDANKVIVDIGTLNENGKGLKSSAKCFLDAFEFLAYLRAELDQNVARLFPTYKEKGFVNYGGNNAASRVFKAHFWMGNDLTAREFCCDHYQPILKEGGAIMPDTANPIAREKVKMTFVDIAILFEALQARVIAQSVRGISVEDTDGPPISDVVESSNDTNIGTVSQPEQPSGTFAEF